MSAHGRQPQRLLAAALAAAGRGWPVFPLHPGSKHPAVRAWETAATCDPVTIAAWWDAAPYNIAIACGPAGLLVVDLDGPGEVPTDWAAAGVRDGREVLAALAGRAGVADPAETHTVVTPAGEHRYFAVDPARPGRSTVGALGWHVDTRAGGGFVVAAGSTRRVAGQRHYYRTSNPSAPAEAPGWILDALEPPSRPQGATPVGSASTIRSTTAYAQAALDGEADAVRDAQHGTRNFILFRAAARLGELVAADLIDEGTVVLALQTAASRHIGTKQFTAAEVDRAIANGLSRGLQHPRALTPAAR
jgi:hypothetical protein